MNVMNILRLIDGVLYFTWPVIALVDLWLRNFNPYRRRMRRGKAYTFRMVKIGPGVILGEVATLFFLCGLSISIMDSWPVHMWWVYVGVLAIVDWITGSEDPPWRRLAKAASKWWKGKIAPAPRPAIDFS